VSIVQSLSNVKEKEMYATIAQTFALLNLPHSLVDAPAFRNMITVIRGCQFALPHRHVLPIEQHRVYNHLKRKVLERLSGEQTYVTLALDGWTNIRKDKVTNVVAMCQGYAFYW
jgi:hypothetical protein